MKPNILIGDPGRRVCSPKRLFARCISTARVRNAAVEPGPRRVEATPQNILSWTGTAKRWFAATGSPFAPVTLK